MKFRNLSRSMMLLAATTFAASACAVPIGNPLNLPFLSECTIYIAEQPVGDLVIELVPGAAGLGCTYAPLV